MTKIIKYTPRSDNKIYSAANLAKAYIDSGRRRAAVNYLKTLPEPIRIPAARLVDGKDDSSYYGSE